MTKKSNTKNAANVPASGTEQFIPLNRLKKSPRNARKTAHPVEAIEALAASIAAHGLLQSPVVEPERDDKGEPTGKFLVTIGEGRRLALLLRAKRKEIAKTEPIRCTIETEHDAEEISLAENEIRTPMHPADQFERFHALHTGKGMSADDIAARFGVTPAVVKQRLKLAAISPVLMRAYRDDKLNLEQLTAYAFTDDHAKQESVFETLGEYAEREDILGALNEENVEASDPRALFVGLEAYQGAGGAISRDLFDEESEGFLTDAAILQRLATEKLAALAEAVKAEGWKWVETMLRYDHSAVSDMRRFYAQPVEPTEEVAEKIALLAAEAEAIDWDSDNADEESERIEAEIEALQGPEVYDPQRVSRAGAIVSIAHDGDVRIERGFIKPEDDIREPRATKEASPKDGPAPIAESLTAELTAYRTAALREALGRHSPVALQAVVHAFAEQAFFRHRDMRSCLNISLRETYLKSHAPDIEQSPAGVAVAERHDEWAKRMPEEHDALWAFVGVLALNERLELLAHCVSLSVDTVHAPKKRVTHNADELATAVNLRMAEVWEPTPENYLARVSKDRILEAVREGASPEAAENIAGLKKQAMAEAAAQRLKGKGWLPSVLRMPTPETSEPMAMAAE
ncbi:ParB/RepB/Spo0J family partition protein [Frankia sp. RB7]|nr:ParB/RepB/Spo0J family partition protein [Frankia sp. RB7]